MMKCWDIDPKKRPEFSKIASEVDHIMEVTGGYLELSTLAVEKEGEVMDDCRDSESPVSDVSASVSQLIKGIKTKAGITIQLEKS